MKVYSVLVSERGKMPYVKGVYTDKSVALAKSQEVIEDWNNRKNELLGADGVSVQECELDV